MDKKINSALISVYNKQGLEVIVKKLQDLRVKIISTGGTADYIENLGIKTVRVEDITNYPSILGGRVKTLHPKIFGGILSQRDIDSDEMKNWEIEPIDLVIVDLYPFEETILDGGTHEELIEKIDIGGVSLIRAAAKNYKDVAVISNKFQYERLSDLLESGGGTLSLNQRAYWAEQAFYETSAYDKLIGLWMDGHKS